MHRTRSVLAASVVLTLGFSSFAVARNGDPVVQGERNGTTTTETEIIANVNGTSASTGGYSTRQSNKSTSGGGAIYGCRSASGGTTNLPCVRANNLSSGLAFEFNATSGPSAGTITVGSGGDTKKPFTTNATGVADGLNADRVDGQNADQIVETARQGTKTRWLLVNAKGEIERQSGGFSIIAAYPGGDNSPAYGNVYIAAGEDLTDNGLTASIALQNRVNVGGGTMNGTNSNEAGPAAGDESGPREGDNEEFAGEISVAQCFPLEIVNCAPDMAKNPNSFVVSPRNSDGSRTVDENRKRFFVIVTE